MKTGTVRRRLLWILGASYVFMLSVNALPGVLRKPRCVKTQAALKDLVLGINNYRVDTTVIQ